MNRAVAITVLAVIVLLCSCNEVQREVLSGDLKSYRIPTSAMEPTIKNGEYALAEPTGSPANVTRGDVIVFKYPIQPETLFAKRVIGLPGDTIEIRRKEVVVNRKPLDEPYAVHLDEMVYDDPRLPEPYKSRDNFGPVTVPADQFFVLGDNRDKSADSRFWGFVPRENIVGRVVLAGPSAGPHRSVGPRRSNSA